MAGVITHHHQTNRPVGDNTDQKQLAENQKETNLF